MGTRSLFLATVVGVSSFWTYSGADLFAQQAIDLVFAVEEAVSTLASDRRYQIDNGGLLYSDAETFRSEFPCDAGSCDGYSSGSCDGGWVRNDCEIPWWVHRSGIFGEFLYLRPGDTDIVYAIEQNDTTTNAFPTGPVGIAAIDMAPGYRVGFALACSLTSSLVARYTHWDGDTQDRIIRNNANVLNSQIIHPSTFTTGGNSLQSSATTGIEFDLIDAQYRHKLFCSDTTIFNVSGGFRYGKMEQTMLAQQEVSVATGLVSVETDVDFHGFGFLLGLDAERRSAKTGMLCYSKGEASFLGGEWTGDYRQTHQFAGGSVTNEYEDFRISPVLETELGIGWQNKSGCIRATAGYMASWWCNGLSTRKYVDGVRSASALNLDETIAFIGLSTRLEIRY
ncbi:hypothetical protein EC9_27210 [Rosistilla ulvae]|uniref:Uncharacterized protein n=1 Tax=Rosistilla ulvae TaxID=1930277 RepID=A0A517M0X0_9BACT|nr:Lpg1974 family pore-forming outer membrane protein [Rosistilla ulvae]QDS88530.1 hypothetical protein EC9_27210 [Rosistilla ulvae]